MGGDIITFIERGPCDVVELGLSVVERAVPSLAHCFAPARNGGDDVFSLLDVLLERTFEPLKLDSEPS